MACPDSGRDRSQSRFIPKDSRYLGDGAALHAKESCLKIVGKTE